MAKRKKKLNLKLKKGALRNYMLRTYGSKAFTSRGTIKVEYLKKALKEGNAHTKKMVLFALNTRKWK
jgi:hypothetical protein